jgi:hypothetical protein
MVAKLKYKRTSITTMRNIFRSLGTFHDPIHSQWSLPFNWDRKVKLRITTKKCENWFERRDVLLTLYLEIYNYSCQEIPKFDFRGNEIVTFSGGTFCELNLIINFCQLRNWRQINKIERKAGRRWCDGVNWLKEMCIGQIGGRWGGW